LRRQSSPEWQLPESHDAGQVQSQISARKTEDFVDPASQQNSGPLPTNGSTAALTSEKSPVNGASGIGATRTAFVTSSNPEYSTKRNYSALIASLQTLGYSISGFIATAVVNTDGQPVAQVAIDELDISPMCEYYSNIMRSTIRGLDQSAFGHFEDTIITSRTHFILLRLVGDKGDNFQVLITTREADPVESLEIMANIESAIESAL
jgi:predicted regulator of Ras-like GTPase activity (Roadblock/LC7/MglB family)